MTLSRFLFLRVKIELPIPDFSILLTDYTVFLTDFAAGAGFYALLSLPESLI